MMRHSAKHVGLRNQQPEACTVHYLLPFLPNPTTMSTSNPLPTTHHPYLCKPPTTHTHSNPSSQSTNSTLQPARPQRLFNLPKQYLLTPQKPTDHTTHATTTPPLSNNHPIPCHLWSPTTTTPTQPLPLNRPPNPNPNPTTTITTPAQPQPQPQPLNRPPNPTQPPFPSQRTKHLNSAWIS